MNSKRDKVCFIDDDEVFEIPLFRSVFGDDFDLICASSFSETCKQIHDRQNWVPELFILDLYLPDARPDSSRLRQIAEDPLALQPDQGEILAAYLNLQRTRQRLQEILSLHHQSYQSGIQLATRVHAAYPQVPIVFYTRKATLAEILECLQLPGIVQVIRKPSGMDPAETRTLTRRNRDRLLAQFRHSFTLTGSKSLTNLKRCCRIVTSNLRASELVGQ